MKKLSFMLVLWVLISCEEDIVRVPTSIVPTSAVDIIVYIGQPRPVIVQVLSQDKVPMSGVEVSFKVVSGPVTIANATSLTDAGGIAYTVVTTTGVGTAEISAKVEDV